MADLHNLSANILILGTFYFYFIYDLNFWIALLLCTFALLTTTYPSYKSIDKKIREQELELLKAKTEWYERRDKDKEYR